MVDNDSAKRHLHVFLCHGSEDKAIVQDIYFKLREDGVEPWLDKENLLPGQDWNAEIRRAVRRSDAILVFLSSTSVRKEGYYQKELKFALDVAEEKPEGTIFIIPVKLNDCELPERLRNWQWVDWREKEAYARVIRALRARADECGVQQLPGEGALVRIKKPVEETSGRVLYRAADIKSILDKPYKGEIVAKEVQSFSPDQVVAISDEALSDVLNSYQSDERRSEEKERLLALIGIRSPYREWQEATTKHHCFRNESDVEVSNTMKLIPVTSSNLSLVGYDPQSKTLEVRFHSGSVYNYFGVPEHLFQGLISAASHGRYLDAYIKKAGFAYEQVR